MKTNRLNVVDPSQPTPRSRADVAGMAIVTQANVALLRTAEARRRGNPVSEHEIQTPSPGPVTEFRESLIYFRTIRSRSTPEVHLRLHEAWGQHCVFCWMFRGADPQNPPHFASLSSEHEFKCGSAVALKSAEVEAVLWCMRLEQRLRHEVGFRQTVESQYTRAIADRIPATAFGTPMADCDDHALLVASCEHAGMLAAVRWIGDARWTWGQDGIMEIDETAILGGSDQTDA